MWERAGGFTLVELMVVIIVLTILTAIIVPEFSGTYQSSLLRSNGMQLMNTLELAHSQAVTQHLPQRLQLDSSGKRFWLEAPQGEGGSRRFEKVEGVPDSEGRIQGKITVEIQPLASAFGSEGAAPSAAPPPPPTAGGDPDAITFHADGTADARAILLRDAQGFELRITIQPATSRVRAEFLGRSEG